MIPVLGRSGKGNGNPHQCSCLGNSMGREAWQAIAHRVIKSDMTERTTPPIYSAQTTLMSVWARTLELNQWLPFWRTTEAATGRVVPPEWVTRPLLPEDCRPQLRLKIRGDCMLWRVTLTSLDVPILPSTSVCPSAFLLRALLNVFKIPSFLSSAGGWRKGTSVHALTSAVKGNWLPEDKMAAASDRKN